MADTYIDTDKSIDANDPQSHDWARDDDSSLLRGNGQQPFAEQDSLQRATSILDRDMSLDVAADNQGMNTESPAEVALEVKSASASPNPLGQGIAAAQNGNRPLARLYLEQAIESHPNHPSCWIWFAWIADSPVTAISALERARESGADPALVESGLAWARSMHAFKFDAHDEEYVSQPDDEVTDRAHAASSTVVLDEESAREEVDEDQTSAAAPDPVDAAAPPHATDGDTKSPATTAQLKDTNLAAREPSAQLTLALPIETSQDEERVAKQEGTALASQDSDPALTAPLLEQTDAAEQLADSSEDSADSPSADELTSEPPPVDNQEETDAAEHLADSSEDRVDSPSAGEPTDAPPAVDDEAPTDDRPTILAVDDSPTILSLVGMSLKQLGYHVITARDGMEALIQLETCQPALILMDINMPHLNGYQLCKLLKKHQTMSKIPVIMLSGKDGVFDKLRGKLCGCDDYITKPFESAELARKVSAYLTEATANA